ncbi:Uncharacterized protein Tcan_18476 [Toxocara canis]|uniref:NADAR domain-containing protein n=1 Tax=Toxocara canis TaxID=6265 RepID=A0A0B2VBD6_TOXCA|nr:Uncharacterized protein Tcan_18476 [Toxocara canis]
MREIFRSWITVVLNGSIEMIRSFDPVVVPFAQGDQLLTEVDWIKADLAQLRNAMMLLEMEKYSLRKGIYKLKLINSRMKSRLNELENSIGGLKGDSDVTSMGAPEVNLDYDKIGRNFILVGGTQDPFSAYFEVNIRDKEGVVYHSVLCYYCYKMAEYFDDKEAMKKILTAESNKKLQEVANQIGGFDHTIWNQKKQSVWEAGQRLKFEQIDWIAKLLVCTGNTYIAVAERDKVFGTGWYKHRLEADKPIYWDGENRGGKFLMKLRHELKETHSWASAKEEKDIRKRREELKKNVWRRMYHAPGRNVMRGRANGCRGYLMGNDYGVVKAY